MATCVGPPDVIALGSFTTLIGNQPAARLGDSPATAERSSSAARPC